MKLQPRRGSHIRSRRGYTLLEVMIASFVLILVLVSCITALQAGLRMVDNARMANLADQTIQSQLESVKLLNWSFIGGTPTKNSSGNWYFQSHQFSNNLATETPSGGWIDFTPQIRNGAVVGNISSTQLSRISAFRMSVVNSTDPTTGAARPDVKRIKVQLQWTGLKKSQVFTREFETFYAHFGANDFYYTSTP